LHFAEECSPYEKSLIPRSFDVTPRAGALLHGDGHVMRDVGRQSHEKSLKSREERPSDLY